MDRKDTGWIVKVRNLTNSMRRNAERMVEIKGTESEAQSKGGQDAGRSRHVTASKMKVLNTHTHTRTVLAKCC